jgi:methanethiol S-methyltransferase
MTAPSATLSAHAPHDPHAAQPATSSMGIRLLTLIYGICGYASFGVVIVYAIGFVGNWLVPKSIDSDTPGPLVISLLINSALLMVFVLQHTVMARPGFKRWFTKLIPASIERSTFVLAASASLALVFWLWRPAPQVLWQVDAPILAWALRALSLAGWITVVAASCMVSHADLFGLRQTWMRFVNKTYTPVGFRLVGLYKLIRHPLMLGFLIAFWVTPVMTVGHLFFAVMTSLYIAMGVWFEERDLVAQHGEDYLEYRRSTRAVLPIPRSRR